MKKILSLEGPDGCGKSKHSELLNDKLNSLGYKSSVFHHEKPTNFLNPYLFFFNQRKELFSKFIDSENDFLVMDRNVLSSIVFSAAKHCYYLDGQFVFDSFNYVRSKEIKDEIEFMNSLASRVLFLNIIVSCHDSTLDNRLYKRSEEVKVSDYFTRRIYSNTNDSLNKLKAIYEMKDGFDYKHISFNDQSKEEFSAIVFSSFMA